jgi:hypothetical protein
MKTLTIHEVKQKGRITFIKAKKNSKFIDVVIALDNYGFTTKIPIEQLEELLK